MTFCRSINVKKVMKLLAFIFEQPSYDIFSKIATKMSATVANFSSLHTMPGRVAQSVTCLATDRV